MMKRVSGKFRGNVMKSKFFTLIFLLFFFLNSFAQERVRSMSDGGKRVYYKYVEEAERVLLECVQNEEFPSVLFEDLILNDDRCFYYDFSKFVEASRNVTSRPLRIIASDDGKLRLYTWDAVGGTMSFYSGIASYKNDNGIQSYSYVPRNEEYETYGEIKDKYSQIGMIACGATDIKTLKGIDGKLIYVVFNHASGSNVMHVTTLNAYVLQNQGLEPYELFPSKFGYSSSYSYHWDPFQTYGTNLNFDDSILFVPETMDGENPYGSSRSTGRSLMYKFNGVNLSFHGVSYPDGLCKDLCNYKYNIVVIDADPWIIRVDKMPNGAVRYASWKNKQESENPDIVIANGYCVSMNLEGEKKNDSMLGTHVSKNEKYIFQNNDYFYEVSWKYDGGFEFTRLHSWNLIVKKNDQVLLNLSE